VSSPERDGRPPARPGSSGDEAAPGLRRRLAKALSVFNPVGVARRLAALEDGVAGLERERDELRAALAALQRELEALRDGRVPALETRADGVETSQRELQAELEALRDDRVAGVENRLDAAERALAEVGRVAAEVRDQRLPAAVGRGDVLIDRLAGELEELASLVERMLAREPLPLPRPGREEAALAAGLGDIQPLLVEAFRGGAAEIAHRLERYLPRLREAAPVLDLGCGRGELLLLLREAGVAARGVEADPALAAAARRRGLEIVEGDALAVLREQVDGSWGAVCAIHLLEHLPPATLLALVHEAHRVLRPGGLFVAECPNPHNLRVGASLFWLDPTHHRPLLPETLRVFLTAAGFEAAGPEYLHPFPADQRLGGALPQGGAEDGLARLAGRLDELLNGPRDFSLVATKPAPPAG